MDRRALPVAGLEIRLFGEGLRPGVRLDFDDVRATAAWLAARMTDARDAHVLRCVAGELDLGRSGDERDLVARLAGALVAGRLVLTRPGERPELVTQLAPEEEERGHEDAFEALQRPPPTHWIEIQLVDEEGEGIAGERFVIVTADGVEHRGFTDALGVARLTQIPGGDCEVRFPGLDDGAWERI